MTLNTLVALLRVVLAASVCLVAVAALILGGSFAPTTVGQFLNPHSELGSRGLPVLIGVSAIAALALVVSLPPLLVVLARSPAARSPERSAIATLGTVVLAVLVLQLLIAFL